MPRSTVGLAVRIGVVCLQGTVTRSQLLLRARLQRALILMLAQVLIEAFPAA
jgi:hypothetical protein